MFFETEFYFWFCKDINIDVSFLNFSRQLCSPLKGRKLIFLLISDNFPKHLYDRYFAHLNPINGWPTLLLALGGSRLPI